MCGGLIELLVRIIILAGIIALIRLLLPWALGKLGFGEGGILMQAVNIIIWVAVCILVIYIIAGIWTCLVGGAGLSHLF
jgi:hypothetical protein